METHLKDVLHMYLGCEVMTPDGIGWLASVGRDRRGMDRLLLNDLVKVDFRKIILTQNSVDGYDKKRNWGHYKLKETAYVPLNAADDAEPEFTMPGGIKPVLRLLSSMTEEEAVEVCKLVTETRRHSSIEVLNIKDTRIEYIDGSRWQADGVDEMNDLEVHFKYLSAPQFAYLLKQGFDLFNLIPSNQAIDATALTPKEKENK